MNKKIFFYICCIFILSSLVLSQESCFGNLTEDCSIYNEIDCNNYYFYNITYFQCSWNLIICSNNISECNLLTTTLTTTTTTTTTTITTTTIIGNSTNGYVNVILLDELGLYSNRHIYLFQNSSNVSRFIQEINLSTVFKVDNGIDYIISIESKNIDILTNPLNSNLQGFLIRYFWTFVVCLFIISIGVYYFFGKKKK